MTGQPNQWTIIRYITPLTTITAGIVSIQAQTMFLAVIHLTDLTPLVRPVPMMEPVMVCVVLTGIPSTAVRISVIAPEASAQNPWVGKSL